MVILLLQSECLQYIHVSTCLFAGVFSLFLESGLAVTFSRLVLNLEPSVSTCQVLGLPNSATTEFCFKPHPLTYDSMDSLDTQ